MSGCPRMPCVRRASSVSPRAHVVCSHNPPAMCMLCMLCVCIVCFARRPTPPPPPPAVHLCVCIPNVPLAIVSAILAAYPEAALEPMGPLFPAGIARMLPLTFLFTARCAARPPALGPLCVCHQPRFSSAPIRAPAAGAPVVCWGARPRGCAGAVHASPAQLGIAPAHSHSHTRRTRSAARDLSLC